MRIVSRLAAALLCSVSFTALASAQIESPSMKQALKQARERSASPAARTQAAAAQPASLAAREKTLHQIFSDYWQDYLKYNPEFASTIGDERYNDQLSDYSVEAYNASLARGRAFLDRLGEVDTAGMTAQEKLSKEILVRDLIQNQEEAQFKTWEMPVNQFFGLQIDLPQLVPQLSFKTQKDYDDYIARLGKIPTAFAQITDNMSLGIDDHRVPPKYLLEKVLTQVDTLAAQKPEDSPFALPLKKFPASISPAEQASIRTRMLAAIAKQVLPAYTRFGKFLKAQYIPAGRTDPGVWSLPDGKAYYAFLVKRSTTTDLTPDQIHQIGLDWVKKDDAAMLAIARKLGYPTRKALEAHMKADPKLHATSREQLLDAYRHDIDQMRTKLPSLFGTLPKAKLIVEPVPAYMEKNQAPAYYQQGSPDGSRPGVVFVNTYDLPSRSLAGVEVIAYHEGLPGHHLQISIAQELTGIPEFRKYTYYTAYTEGWGLYSERLGKDAGFYQDPYSDYERLDADMWRALRLVVDTGVHSQHWSRQQMVDCIHQYSGLDDTTVQAEVDRYIAWPAQALGYKIGQLKILELRAHAQQELGPQFDIRAFHDTVLDSGALPLDILAEQVDAWIAQRKSQQKPN